MIGAQSVKTRILFMATVLLTVTLVPSSFTVLSVHAQSSMPNPSCPSSIPILNPANIGAADSTKNAASTFPTQTQFLVIIAVLLALIVALIIALIIMNSSKIRNRWRSS